MLASSPTLAPTEPSVDPWTALTTELDQWQAAGRCATVWWRDDDAIAPSAALGRLLDLADRHSAPVSLAVVPKNATPALVGGLAGRTNIEVLQHGWAHINHAGSNEKKIELGDHRPIDVILGDLKKGYDKLAAMFGGQFRPVLVPPWNRIGHSVGSSLSKLGISGLSLFGPRKTEHFADRVLLSNTHVDPIAWRGSRGFAGEAETLAEMTAHLSDRRTHRVDTNEPTGLLTHHLVHDQQTWSFVDRWLDTMARHSAVQVLSSDDVFQGIGP
jgi:hypothetical protein